MIKLQAKRFELNFLLKFSDLKSNFTLTSFEQPGPVYKILNEPWIWIIDHFTYNIQPLGLQSIHHHQTLHS